MIKTAVYCMRAMAHFGTLIAKILDVPCYIESPVGDVDTVYIIGMYDPPYYGYTLQNTARAKRRVIHWCGSDVQFLEDSSNVPEAIHLAESDNLKRELFNKGIESEVVTFPTKHHFECYDLPEKPGIAFYMGSNAEKYGASVATAVMECLGDDYNFFPYVLGQYDSEGMAELIKNSSVALRLTKHDGSMNTPREFMEAGRRAVVTSELPFAKLVRPDDLVQIVSAVARACKETEPDYEAASYYHEFNSVERYLDDMGSILE